MNIKKILWVTALLTLLLTGARKKPFDTIRLTIVNKSEMEIAVQLQAKPRSCCNMADSTDAKFYYLPVLEGSRETPTVKEFDIEKETYGMQVFYIETWDPVYGFKCTRPAPNALMALRDMRVIILPCDETPGNIGEPSMRKYLPFPVQERFFFGRYWVDRLIY
jgi:hypothetical protein